jgi:hypothetical protein
MSSCFSEDMVITPNTEAKMVISAMSARFPRDRWASRNIA